MRDTGEYVSTPQGITAARRRKRYGVDWSVPTPASWDVVLEAEKLREPKNGKKAVEKVFSVD